MPNLNRRYWPFVNFFMALMLIISACTAKAVPTQTSPAAKADQVPEVTPSLPEEVSLKTPIISVTPEPILEMAGISESETLPTQPESTSTAHSYPELFYIKGIVGHVQVYELGCEASAAVDWANYFGKTIYEFNFQSELPVSDNPDFGYVGDPDTNGWGQIPPYAYGVHSDSVAELLVAYDLPAQSKKNYTLAEIREKLGQSKPVIVWIIGNMEYSVQVEYTNSQGRKSIVAPYEHVVILTGYDQNTVRYMSNGRFYDVPNEVFLTSWRVLGNMAVVHE